MRCSSCEPLLDAYLEGALSRRRAFAVGAHLRACDDCAAFLAELRVVDALLTTARVPGVAADFTATIVSATAAAAPHSIARPRRSLGVALLLYVALAWTLAAFAVVRWHAFAGLPQTIATLGRPDLAALGAAARALAPATPVVAAAGTGVLLLDVLLLATLAYGYRRLRPLLAFYFREPRP
jgi:anti-sigma factor RsiW